MSCSEKKHAGKSQSYNHIKALAQPSKSHKSGRAKGLGLTIFRRSHFFARLCNNNIEKTHAPRETVMIPSLLGCTFIDQLEKNVTVSRLRRNVRFPEYTAHLTACLKLMLD